MQAPAIRVRSSGPAAPRQALYRAQSRTRLVVRASQGSSEWTGRQFTMLATSAESTSHLAKLLAKELRRGDSLCLKGDQGAGKSTFAREFIRAVYSDAGKEVAPPTGNLTPITYTEHEGPTIQHLDLRSASAPGDAERAALVDSFASTVSLIECAERLQEWGAAPEQRLAIWIRRLPSKEVVDYAEQNVRLITVVPHTGSWELRAGLLHAELSQSGTAAGLVMLGDDMAASLIKGLPESLLLSAVRA